VLFETDPDKTRAIAREHLHVDFTGKYDIAKFLRLGYNQADIDGGRGSDRLVDDLVVWGDLDTIAGKLHDHLDAGADHVGIQVLGIAPGRSAMPTDAALAKAGRGAAAPASRQVGPRGDRPRHSPVVGLFSLVYSQCHGSNGLL
jgi:hypothetical protein